MNGSLPRLCRRNMELALLYPCCSTCAVFVRCVRRPGAALHRGCAATTCTAAGAESRSASAQWNKGVALQAQLTLSFSGAAGDRRARELGAAHSGGVRHALATLHRAAVALHCAVVPQPAAVPGGGRVGAAFAHRAARTCCCHMPPSVHERVGCLATSAGEHLAPVPAHGFSLPTFSALFYLETHQFPRTPASLCISRHA